MPHPTMTDEVSPRTALNGMLSAYQVVQSIFVVTTLGIPEVLRGGPKSGDELARSTGADPGALSRLLRFLTREGIFTEDGSHLFPGLLIVRLDVLTLLTYPM